MYLVEHERTKLTATWLNTLATALIAADAIAPAAAIAVGVSMLPIALSRVVLLAVGCVVFGTAIHIGARAVLGSLRE